jgi:hypothetical protein
MMKPSVVEWVGSDVRNPEILFKLNSYYKYAFHNGYEYANYESVATSSSNQLKFKNLGSIPLVNPEIDLFVDRNIFPIRHFVWPRLLMNAYRFSPPSRDKKRPLLLHAPTAMVAKGSSYVIDAVEELKAEFDFDFVLLHGMKRESVMSYMEQCEIFIDQVVLGMYGLATCEAMCFGKPVMCYLMPSVVDNGLPVECPIINTTVESLKNNIRKLLENPQLRFLIGTQSRNYAEKFFDSTKSSEMLIDIYKQVIDSHSMGHAGN